MKDETKCPHTNIHKVDNEWQCKKCDISFGFGKNPTREPVQSIDRGGD
jgi:hypothetical protein